MERPAFSASLVVARSSPRDIMESHSILRHPAEKHTCATTALVNSPVTARRGISSPEQERKVTPPNIVSSIPQVLKIPFTERMEEDELWRGDPVRSRNRLVISPRDRNAFHWGFRGYKSRRYRPPLESRRRYLGSPMRSRRRLQHPLGV